MFDILANFITLSQFIWSQVNNTTNSHVNGESETTRKITFLVSQALMDFKMNDYNKGFFCKIVYFLYKYGEK